MDVTLDPPALGVRSGERPGLCRAQLTEQPLELRGVPARALRAVEREAALLGEQVDEPLGLGREGVGRLERERDRAARAGARLERRGDERVADDDRARPFGMPRRARRTRSAPACPEFSSGVA